MLSSLFGELTPQRLPDAAAGDGSVIALADDIVVDASPAAAIRRHFADHRSDLQRASAMVTLLDPSRLWASQVLRALSDATAQPLQRLNLRERATLRTLAVIERALVPRRDANALRVYHADIRANAMEAGLAQEEIGNALAEGSQLTAVIVGAMQPHALVALLRSLLQATRQPGWRCPRLVFILPPGAAALRQRILEQPWPARVQADAVAEPLACAASVWNCVLEAWEAAVPAPQHFARPPSRQRESDPGLPQALSRLIAPLAAGEGVLACGIVDLDGGGLLVRQGRDDADLPGVALALCAARQAHQALAGPGGRPDETLITAGPRQTLLRALPGDAGLGFVALLDRQQANLALLRFKLLEAERLLLLNHALKPGRWRADKAVSADLPEEPAMSFTSVHNAHEKTIFDTVVATAPRYPALAGNAELLADVACVALNRLPPHYIRHSTDLAFFTTDREREALQRSISDSVDFAFGYVQARHAMAARR